MSSSSSRLLALLIVAAGAAALVCSARMTGRREAAVAAARDLSDCQRFAAQLDAGGAATAATPGSAGSPAAGDDPEMSRRIRDAAAAAGIPDRLVGIEPGEPRRLPGGEYDEMLVFLRFDAVSLKDLTAFLHRLAQTDPGSRAKSVELAPPPEPAVAPTAAGTAAVGTAGTAGGGVTAGAAGVTELWSADVTLAYLFKAPARDARPRGAE